MRTRIVAMFLVSLGACGGSPPRQTPTVGSTAERVVQTIDDNLLRVVVVNTGDIAIGQRTDAFGMPLAGTIPSGGFYFGETLPITSAAADLMEGYPPTAAQLSSGGYRLYSRTLEVDAEASASFGAISAANNSRVNRYEVIREWSRYVPRRMQSTSTAPHVTGADLGFAVRMVMHVDILTTESESAAEIGIGTIDAALATNRSEILVTYQVVGATYALLPQRATRISNTEQFYEAQQEFHELTRDLSAIWQAEAGVCRSCESDESRPACCAYSDDTREPVIRPAVLAYYAHGVDIGWNVRRLERKIAECNADRRGMLTRIRGLCNAECEDRYRICLNRVDEWRRCVNQGGTLNDADATCARPPASPNTGAAPANGGTEPATQETAGTETTPGTAPAETT